MKIYFACPQCGYPGQTDNAAAPVWHCPRCEHLLSLEAPNDTSAIPTCCQVCGNGELYKKKDFPHALGLAILTFACIASTITYGLYDKWLTWAILIGSAAFDGLLYLWVKDVVVCYRCQAHHRGIAPGSAVPAFNLAIGERYRQEEIRKLEVRGQRSEVRSPEL